MLTIIVIVSLLKPAICYWDIATTTLKTIKDPLPGRQSFFRWMWTASAYTMTFQSWWWDWDDIERRRRLCVVAGLSIDFLPLSTAVLLNRRVLLTSYNYLDPYMNRQEEMRIWAAGREGLHYTPYRYRVYRVTRLLPWSLNPEHCHGPRCLHQPRHDVAIVFCRDQMYLFIWNNYYSKRYFYPHRTSLTGKRFILGWDLWFSGSGFEDAPHAYDNHYIVFCRSQKADIVDCSNYLPKWWGKFICIRNVKGVYGVQNGGGLFSDWTMVGLGCFEIRYNEDRILVFTDLRYYYDKIQHYAHLEPGWYYEYAYPQWSIRYGTLGLFHDNYNVPYIPHWQKWYDLYPLGK